jgi:tetraacyldisaccharide 4'-kinase
MQRWLESQWARIGPAAILLLPLTAAFAVVTSLRRALYRAGFLKGWRARVPVIVVGNITVGGSGKTPLVIAIVERLREAGFRPGVVSRGYGAVPPGTEDPLGVVRVFPGVTTPERAGDEPVLIAERCGVPVFVSTDRPRAVQALLAANPEVDVVVSDDGLQHYALARQVEIAVVDGARLFGNGMLLPSGPLREPVARLASVDAVVLNGGAASLDLARRSFSMAPGNERFVSLADGRLLASADFALMARGLRTHAIAGIAHPARFFDHLARLGVHATGHPFSDHHAFQPGELRLPEADLVVMTEKDAVKCRSFADARMWSLSIDAILPGDFDRFLLDCLKAKRGSQAP